MIHDDNIVFVPHYRKVRGMTLNRRPIRTQRSEAPAFVGSTIIDQISHKIVEGPAKLYTILPQT